MVKMVNFTLCLFYYKKNSEEKNFQLEVSENKNVCVCVCFFFPSQVNPNSIHGSQLRVPGWKPML